MYRVMIVDDEALERQGLLLILEKQFGNDIEITDVSNGKKAIEMAYQLKPDFVFMDMKMPGIDGIEAIKAIKEISPKTKFVVVSAYDSFYYAQKAINANVFAYLLKPVKRKDIIDCMDQLMATKKAELGRMHDELELKQQIQELKPFYEHELIQSVLYNNQEKLRTLDQMQLLEHPLEPAYCMVIEMIYTLREDGDSEGSMERLKNRVEEKIRQYFKDHFDGIIGNVAERKMLAVVYDELLGYEETQVQHKKRIAERLVRSLQDERDLHVYIGIGQGVAKLDMLNQSYQSSVTALNQTLEKHPVLHIAEIEIVSTEHDMYPLADEKALCLKIKQGLKEDAEVLYNKVFDWIDRHVKDPEEKRIKFLEFAAVLDRSIAPEIEEVDWRDESSLLLEKQLVVSAIPQLKMKLWNEIVNAIHKILLLRDEGMDNIINKAKTYIRKNYVHEISLEEISQHVAVSPYYFSKLFKQETGENFIDFLTKVRIEKAKEMLRTTDLSMKMIARRVGYKDPNYFSRVFKKVTKMKPSDFKQK